MKKSLSVILAIVMLVSSLSISSISAFARTSYSKAPEVFVGDTIAVSFTENEDFKPEFAAKFVAPETKYYEFIFDSPIKDESGMLFLDIVHSPAKNNDYYGFSIADEFFGSDDEKIGIAAKLTAGTTYYLTINGFYEGTYESNVSVNKHSHSLKRETFAAGGFENLSDFSDGYVADCCEYCSYEKKISTIYSPKTITLSKTSYVYDGKAKKPTVTVKDRKGNKISSKKYDVVYENNYRVGTATVTIEFKDEYYGYIVKTFKINPKATKISSITAKSKGFNVRWNRVTTQSTGYQVQRADNSKFTKNKKTYTITGTRNSSKTVTGLKAKKKYYVRVRTYRTVNGKKYYSAWSGYRTVTTKR